MGIKELLSSKRPEILRAAESHGAMNVRVFGSVARGEASAESDVDLLIHLKKGRGFTDPMGFCEDVETVLGRRVDVVTDDGLSPFLRATVLAEAVPL
jgi:predicted nucleotidyltransferase